MNKKLQITKWNQLNDTQRWKALLNGEYSNFQVMLDNDYTYLQLLTPLTQDDEELVLEFDEHIGWADGVLSLLLAAKIKHSQV